MLHEQKLLMNLILCSKGQKSVKPLWKYQCCQDVPRSHPAPFLLSLPSHHHSITSSRHLSELCPERVLRKPGHGKRGPLRWRASSVGFAAVTRDPSTGQRCWTFSKSEGRMAVSVSAFGPCPPHALSNFLTSFAAPFYPWWGGPGAELISAILISAGSDIIEFLRPHLVPAPATSMASLPFIHSFKYIY